MQQPYAAEYNRLYHEHWWWRSREAILLDVLAKFCPRRGDLDILDVGCGDGLFFPELERSGGSVASRSTRACSTRRALPRADPHQAARATKPTGAMTGIST